MTVAKKALSSDLIEQPESTELAKLLVVIGRCWCNLNELGGHGENLGGLATAYVFFGKVWGLAYLAVCATCLFIVKKSYIHPCHI